MSETVHYKGKMKRIQKNGRTIEETFLSIITKEQIEIFQNFNLDDLLEDRICEFSDTYIGYHKVVVIDGELLVNIENKEIGEFDIFDMHPVEKDIYQYDLMYYNGGCCFDEAIEMALKNSGINIKGE